jgi:hypothetical protein
VISKLRIFVSSPGDVSEERALAERVFKRLEREFAEAVELELVLWEHEPLFGHADFQTQIELAEIHLAQEPPPLNSLRTVGMTHMVEAPWPKNPISRRAENVPTMLVAEKQK